MTSRFLTIAAALVLIGAAAAPGARAQETGHPHDHAANPLKGPVVAGVPAPDVATVAWAGSSPPTATSTDR